AAMGEVTKIQPEGEELVMIFQVPKAPETDLKDYRELRAPLEVEPVTDEAVKAALESLLESRAVIEDVDRPAKIGDEIEVDLKVTWWHDGDHDEHDHDEDEAD